VVRGKIVNVSPQASRLNVHLVVVTSPGATVNIVKEP
jgi:hypothetical protein